MLELHLGGAHWFLGAGRLNIVLNFTFNNVIFPCFSVTEALSVEFTSAWPDLPPQWCPRNSEQYWEQWHCLRRSVEKSDIVEEAQDQDVVPSEGAAAVAGGQHLRDLGVAGQPHRLLSPPRPQDRGGVNNCDFNGHRFYNIRRRLRLRTVQCQNN